MFHFTRTVTAVCAAFALASCGSSLSGPVGPSPDGVDLRGSTIGGDFTLTSSTGSEVSWSDFKGQYRLVYFGFAYCPDVCPTDVARFSQGLGEFEKKHPELGAKVQPIFITIDPERDDQPTVASFIGNFHPRLLGLTGSPEAIAETAKKFSVTAAKGEVNESGSYDIEHTAFTYLFDPEGKPLGIIPTDKGPEGVTAELEQWVR
ncbi:redoxin domain-containing protein [Altererythrobacter aestiaquae]|uniref:Redoxin domain-containing protein n=2 Tax=Pontixanthobacter aestiaquae TaxID=1509367 RepID=A0A844Z637_9SPHN|nr:redoxin domain-containing protein [Pontixanthobacter aestiaquae]